MARELPDKLHINEDYEITELLTSDGVSRILLSPSKCYLNDDIVQLEAVIEEIVKRYNSKPELFQLHHQSKIDFTTEMVAQKKIYCQEDMSAWWKDVAKSRPLPEDCEWLVCNEESEHFVMAATT